ncbi:MAG: DNA repair protein RecN [Oscillospiraceae bacterium]|nr:DNA repair protein RecN [Oscillospiraceae bacterium]
MLHELHIENIAVIERADVTFGEGLNILTGETGAGKSILVDSLYAVLGGRVSRELVRTGAQKAAVCATFDPAPAAAWCAEHEIELEDELILRRQISADGKSTCRVCGVPIPASQLRELGALLLDIHGQNDGQQLLDERRHLAYLDAFGVRDDELQAFHAAYQTYAELCREQETLRGYEDEKELLTESLRSQIDELTRAELREGEEDELTERRDLLRNFEKLSESMELAYDLLDGRDDSALSLASEAESAADRAAAFASELSNVPATIREATMLLQDAVETLRDYRGSLDFSEEEYDRIETRLSLLRKLQRKYRTDEAGLIRKLADAQERLDQIEYADDRLIKLEKLIDVQEKTVKQAASVLTQVRRAAAAELERQVVTELRALAMPAVKFQVEITPVGGSPGFQSSGGDVVRFLLSANAGEAPGRISRIASGGELSRIMLALKNVFAMRDAVPSMVFDEVDTGVSGIAAQRVGEKLAELSGIKQVICITHLPQIAAMADHHFLIEKHQEQERTRTSVQELSSAGRAQEIARLHGGDNITELTLASAAEQLRSSEAFKDRINRKGD